MRFHASALVCLVFLMICDHCNSKRMICEDIEDEETVSDLASRCPSGEQGAKGEQGFQGRPGHPGIVNYKRLDEIVTSKVAEETQKLKAKVDEMSTRIRNMTQKTPATCDGVVYNGRCFLADVHPDEDVTFWDAFQICRKQNYELANIYSEGQYNAVMRYIESKMEGRSYIHVWTGMIKMYKELAARMTNGAQSNFTRPRDDSEQWREAGPKRTHVYLQIQARDEGMGAIWPSYSLHGPLCQYYTE